jgi:hypothetical protein
MCVLHYRWTAHPRRAHGTTAHGFTALPLAPSTTSSYLPLQVEANPFSSSLRSPPLALLYHPQAHSAWHHQPPATTNEHCLKHRRLGAPSDSSDRAFVHQCATSPHPKVAKVLSHLPPSTGTSPWTAASGPPSAFPTPPRGSQCCPGAPRTRNPPPLNPDHAITIVLPRLNRATVNRSPGELPVFSATPNRFPTTPRPS